MPHGDMEGGEHDRDGEKEWHDKKRMANVKTDEGGVKEGGEAKPHKSRGRVNNG